MTAGARPSHVALVTVAASLTLACTDVGQTYVELPLYAAGSELPPTLLAVGDVTLRIDRAELAFGPLYLCAGTQAGELCDTARLEWLRSTRIDLTDPEPRRAGTLTGTTGSVRSWMYDLGISSQLTRGEPFVLDAARQLGGASLLVRGSARSDGPEVPFEVAVVVQQGADVERGVPVIRKSPSDAFGHEIAETDSALWVTFDLSDWLARVDMRSALSASPCTLEGDCSEPLRLEPDGQAYRGLYQALVSGRRPELSWQRP